MKAHRYLLFLCFTGGIALMLSAQQERRSQHPGNGPAGSPDTVLLAHRLGTDHAEGITTLDMNGDGFADLVRAPIGTRIRVRKVETGSSTSGVRWASMMSSFPIAASGPWM